VFCRILFLLIIARVFDVCFFKLDLIFSETGIMLSVAYLENSTKFLLITVRMSFHLASFFEIKFVHLNFSFCILFCMLEDNSVFRVCDLI